MLGPDADTLRACPDIHNRHEPSLCMARRWPLVLRASNLVPDRSQPLDAPAPKPFLVRYGSVCSGIEAASVAWHDLGWEPQWFSEIEQFPSEVLKHRFPAVPNLGDMTTINQNPIADERPIDLLVGGTPCQSFSVAGLRKGLADPRGNLMLTFLSIADKFRPKWVVWENVPGVLSSNGGKDFGTFLGALGELGYGFAYRVLDAQFFGVAQRRRRVFVVGYLGDWRVAAAVLFERESLQGNTKPSRKKREEVATDAQGSVGEAGDVSCVGGNLSPTVTSKWMKGYGGPSGSNETGNMVYAPTIIDQSVGKWVSPNGEETIGTIMARDYKGLGNQDLQDGRGLTIRPHAVAQPIAYSFDSLSSNSMKSSNPDSGCRAVDVAKTLDTATPEPSKNQGGIAIAQPIAFKVRGGCEGGGKGYLGQEEQAFTISTMQDQQIAQPIAVDTYNQTISEHTSQTIGSSASDVNHYGAVLHSMAIRRLTPKECERLQGFPDDWTKIPYRNKEADQCPDGPRYKACGNSMAVPVMRWIGERINLIESIL
jgi:DNA (cytosine-5)-methyltransferase 1